MDCCRETVDGENRKKRDRGYRMKMNRNRGREEGEGRLRSDTTRAGRDQRTAQKEFRAGSRDSKVQLCNCISHNPTVISRPVQSRSSPSNPQQRQNSTLSEWDHNLSETHQGQ